MIEAGCSTSVYSGMRSTDEFRIGRLTCDDRDFPKAEQFAIFQSLIKLLFDITLLRKGPEDIPASAVLFAFILALWLFSGLAGVVLIASFDETQFLLGLFTGLVGIICYASVVVLSGQSARLLQTVSAIVGCGALISLAVVAEYVLFLPFLGQIPTSIIATLIVFWSVPVKGHIIARAIGRHWYIGIAIAIAIFSLQFAITDFIGREA